MQVQRALAGRTIESGRLRRARGGEFGYGDFANAGARARGIPNGRHWFHAGEPKPPEERVNVIDVCRDKRTSAPVIWCTARDERTERMRLHLREASARQTFRGADAPAGSHLE